MPTKEFVMRVVHYLNQFFGGLGGEEKAGTGLESRDGAVGPGKLLEQLLGSDCQVVTTLICGDNYAVENQEALTAAVLEKVRTRAKAVEKLVEFIIEFTHIEKMDLLHSTTPEDVALLIEQVNLQLPNLDMKVEMYGPSLGAFLGPGALGVVLPGDRRAPHRHDRVADELLDGAAVALELGLHAGVIRGEHPPYVLGIELLRAAGEADEVGEEDGDDLALLEDGRLGLAGRHGRAAAGAEPELECDDLAAGWAGAAELVAATAAEQRSRPVLEAAGGAFGH
jgi:hypothetical protein